MALPPSISPGLGAGRARGWDRAAGVWGLRVRSPLPARVRGLGVKDGARAGHVCSLFVHSWRRAVLPASACLSGAENGASPSWYERPLGAEVLHCTRGPDGSAPRGQEPERLPLRSVLERNRAIKNLQVRSVGLAAGAVCAVYRECR